MSYLGVSQRQLPRVLRAILFEIDFIRECTAATIARPVVDAKNRYFLHFTHLVVYP
jgi:hypothetical protein